MSPRCPKTPPRHLQDASKTLQEASKTPLRPPKTSPRRLWTAQRRLQAASSCLETIPKCYKIETFENLNPWIFIVFHSMFHHFSCFQASYGEAKGRPLWVSNLFVKMHLQHFEMNIEADGNDFKWMFGNREWENPWKLNVLKTCPGCCGWNMSSQKPHWWHEASGCTQYLWTGCVFHCRSGGGLPPQPKFEGSGGRHPPAKTEKPENKKPRKWV